MSSDLIDAASDLEMAEREYAINSARNKPKKVHLHCLTCNAPTDGAAYCSVECKEDGELMDKLETIRGYR